MLSEGRYICQACGEEIVVEVDPSAGARQQYSEDCPVCCRPHLLTVRIEAGSAVSIEAEAE